MNNFTPIGTFDPRPMLAEISQVNLWNWMSLRKLFPESGHYDVDDIIMRFHPVDRLITEEQVFNSNETVSYFPWHILQYCRALVEQFKPEGYEIGRAMVAKLRPLGAISPHVDEGDYATNHIRYHFVLYSNPNCIFIAGNEAVNMQTGEVWTFNNKATHQVINLDKNEARIHLIADYRKAQYEN